MADKLLGPLFNDLQLHEESGGGGGRDARRMAATSPGSAEEEGWTSFKMTH